jgi:hypothetical protein
MKLTVFALALVAVPAAALAQAPAQPSGPAAEALAAYNRVKPNIVKAAEKMPADQYSYKPAADIRTYARVVNHVTEAQSHTCSVLAGTKFEASMVPPETAGKDEQVKALKESFELCDKAFASLKDGELMEVLAVGPAKRSKIGLAWGTVSHDNEQYATLALYLRLKGIAPPSSEK